MNRPFLELNIGPMFSGKTSLLIEKYNQCIFCNIPVMAITHVLDNYDETLMCSHDKTKIPCTRLSSLMELLCMENSPINAVQVIIINEGQFYPDLYEAVQTFLNMGKQIFVSGLDGDFERNKFGQILDIIPLCDKVTKLTSMCGICRDGTPGIFSKRITSETIQTVVGADHYIPVCRKCFNN